MHIIIMSKTSKAIKMTLGEFNQYVDQQHQQQRARTHRMPTRSVQKGRGTPSGSGKLSDRLKARRNQNQSGPDRSRPRPMARVVSKVPAVSQPPVFDTDTFPALVDVDTVKIRGCWSQGIQSIRDAKDLPEPAKVQEQEEKERRSRRRYDSYSDYSDYSDDEQALPAHAIDEQDTLAEVAYSDDEDWDEL